MAKTNDLDIAFDGYEPGMSRTRTGSSSSYGTDFEAPTPLQRNRRTPAPIDEEPEDPKKKEEAPATEQKERSGFFSFVYDERLRLVAGLLMIVICIFIVIALVFHFKYGGVDQSIVLNTPLKDMPSLAVQNAAGGFGAKISYYFLCGTLGLGSLAFIYYAWMLGLALLGFKKCNFWSLTFKTLLMAITISTVLGLITYTSGTVMKWGGVHGHYINAWLMAFAGPIGAILFSIILISLVAIVYINELRAAWRKWKDVSNRRKLQEELRRQRHEKIEEMADVAEETDDAQHHTASQPIDIEVREQDQHAQPIVAIAAEPASVASTFAPATPLDDIFSNSDNDEIEIPLEEPQPEEVNEPEELSEDVVIFDTPQEEPAPADEVIAVLDDNNVTKEEETLIDLGGEVGEHTTEGETIVQENFSVKTSEIEKADVIHPGAANPGQSPYYDHRAELSRYKFPTIDLLTERKQNIVIDMEEQQANKERIEKVLGNFNVQISRIEATVGPTVTLYEIVPAEGVRISQIKRLEDDIALSLSALGIRIIAPIPGKPTVGIEVPNSEPQTVSMRSVITSKKYQESKMALPMAMGATINNEIFIADLAKMPHLLVAGATGMGKSVGLNAIITSLLYAKHPSELKFVLVDPKMVEFSLYSKLERHYLAKLPDEEEAIITEPKKVVQTLNSLCIEMDNRYSLLKMAGVRALEEYNKKFSERRLNPNDGHKYLPYLVVVVDEFADLIMTAGKEVEAPIMRIAQKARAVGIHMIIATQRPSANVITGPIKANFPGRIAFRVIQMVDSKVILDCSGANQLIGRGDMLFNHNGSMERVQCAFISTEEVEAITDWIDNQVGYEHAYYLPEYVPEGEDGGGSMAGASTDRDPMFEDIARAVVGMQISSTSMLQRKFNIGFNRAARLMDQLEAAGIVGPANGAKPRAILVDIIGLDHILSQR